MATGTIPFSNPGGNNQFLARPQSGNNLVPGAGGTNKPIPLAGASGTIPITGSPVKNPANPNPFVANPPTTSSSGATPNTSASGGFITNNSSYSSGENDLQKQLIDIYGKGVGGSLFALLNNMSGSDSTILQQYIASLQPQMATAQANTNAALGAGGVSANSSVAAIADANLQSQEFAAISGESAKLTMSQEELTAQLLSGMEGPAAKEVATSGWDVFANVMNNITGDIGNIVSGSSYQSPQAQQQATPASTGSGIPGYGGVVGQEGSQYTDPTTMSAGDYTIPFGG